MGRAHRLRARPSVWLPIEPRHTIIKKDRVYTLAPRVAHYLFVSSISVYPDFSVPRDEKSPVGKLADEAVEKVDGDTYGPLKALCEQAVLKALPGRTTIIRPGLIVGPDDNTDRFTYWPARAARGGEFIAPGAAQDPFQVIDVRDLAAFVLKAVERNITGTFRPKRSAIPAVITHGSEGASSGSAPKITLPL